MDLLKINEYLPARIAYSWLPERGAFRHNLNRDLHCFALWESSRDREQDLCKLIEERFSILQFYEVEWSERNVASNFNRLYGRDPFNESSRHRQVGSGPFLFIIAEDPDPLYIYWTNNSGRVELTNKKVATLKPELRALVDNGFPYNVHSSNSVEEFFRDACLILGPEEFSKSLETDPSLHTHRRQWREDLAGAEGWRSIEQLFATMAYSQRLAILRSFEDASFPTSYSQGDIDLLCDDIAFFKSELNGRHISGQQYVTRVAGTEVKFDLREVGDYDLDKAWQDAMLRNVDASHFPFLVPEISDRFFYLLYHVKVQKGYIKPDHGRFLEEISQTIGLALKKSWVGDDVTAAQVLNGYLRASGYAVITPRWPAKKAQRAFISMLDQDLVRSSNTARRYVRSLAVRCWTKLRSYIRKLPILGPSLAWSKYFVRRKLTRHRSA